MTQSRLPSERLLHTRIRCSIFSTFLPTRISTCALLRIAPLVCASALDFAKTRITRIKIINFVPGMHT
jgi:hypothetical protein